MVREGRVFIANAGSGKPEFGANYYVTAYEVGAVVASGSSGNTVTVDAGHGFEANDKGMVGAVSVDDATFRYFQVGSVTSGQLALAGGQTLSVAAGEILVNLGTDTGFTEPNYDGSGAVVYTDMDYGNVALNSTVLTTDLGGYIYWHKNIDRWDLVRDSGGSPYSIVMDTGASGDFLPLDLDGDGTDEIEPGASPFTANDYLLYLTHSYDASLSSASVGRVQSGIKLVQTWTGDSTAASTNREGVFAINRFGDNSAGTGGGTASGPSIAIGGYSEHYGNSTWASSNGAFCGGELAASLYGPTDMDGTMFGCLGISQVANGTLGGTATAAELVGVRGVAMMASGDSVIATAVGVDGVITKSASSLVTNAYAVRANFATPSGAGSITSAYGVKVDGITAGATNNYGVYITGASGGATNNEALYVASGKSTFADTTAFHVIKTNATYFNDGTDRDATLFFDTATADGAITYKGGSATNVFEFNKPFRQISSATAIFTVGYAEELLTLSTGAATTDTSANLLPANSLILAVSGRVTTTITTAANWKLGDGTQAARFTAANSTLTAGTTDVGLLHHNPTVATADLGPVQTAAAKVRVTCNTTPGAGAIRITVAYLSFSAALS